MTVATASQLREALRIAEHVDTLLQQHSDTDSVQVHLTDTDGALRFEVWSNERGQQIAVYDVDAGQAPGETGVARLIHLTTEA